MSRMNMKFKLISQTNEKEQISGIFTSQFVV